MVDQIWYYRDQIAGGSFGLIFAGINEKDGREVAVKRVEKLRMKRPEDRREIKNLTALADCEQVVRYLRHVNAWVCPRLDNILRACCTRDLSVMRLLEYAPLV
jgi:hypothetical protein